MVNLNILIFVIGLLTSVYSGGNELWPTLDFHMKVRNHFNENRSDELDTNIQTYKYWVQIDNFDGQKLSSTISPYTWKCWDKVVISTSISNNKAITNYNFLSGLNADDCINQMYELRKAKGTHDFFVLIVNGLWFIFLIPTLVVFYRTRKTDNYKRILVGLIWAKILFDIMMALKIRGHFQWILIVSPIVFYVISKNLNNRSLILVSIIFLIIYIITIPIGTIYIFY